MLVLVLSAAVLVLSAAVLVLVLSAAVLVLSAAVIVLSAAVIVLSSAVLVLSAAVIVIELLDPTVKHLRATIDVSKIETVEESKNSPATRSTERGPNRLRVRLPLTLSTATLSTSPAPFRPTVVAVVLDVVRGLNARKRKSDEPRPRPFLLPILARGWAGAAML